MKMSTLSSLFVLLSVVSLIAIAPSAFAAHHEVTITNAPGSATPGCEDTNNCFIPSVATVDLGTIVTWENTDGMQLIQQQLEQQLTDQWCLGQQFDYG